jgi:hypothetical protein
MKYPHLYARTAIAVVGLVTMGGVFAGESPPAAPAPPAPPAITGKENPKRIPGVFLVFFKESDTASTKNVQVLAQQLAQSYNGKVTMIYDSPGVHGFRVEMADADAEKLVKDPRVQIYAAAPDL